MRQTDRQTANVTKQRIFTGELKRIQERVADDNYGLCLTEIDPLFMKISPKLFSHFRSQ